MTRPGNHELAPEELSTLLGGELPLENWEAVTLLCQLDAIGPSDDTAAGKLTFSPSSRMEPRPLWLPQSLVGLGPRDTAERA